MHCHSSESDGILSPESLVSRALRQDVAVLALTDHDTVSGIAKAREQAQIEGLDFVPGIEFSSQWRGRGVHVVGLNIDCANSALLNLIEEQRVRRDERAERIAKKLASVEIEGALEGARELADGEVVTRPHFARFLVESGHCRDLKHAFKRYLGKGRPAEVKVEWPWLGDVVDVICAAGGQAVLAHPDKYGLTKTKLRELLIDFKEAGGAGMEVISGRQNEALTRSLAALAEQFDLLGSCGSDFHRPDEPWQELGGHSPLPDNVRPIWDTWPTP